MKNTIFYISIIIIILIAAGIFLSKFFQTKFSPLSGEANGTFLSLSSESPQYKVGDLIKIDVYLESEQSFDGLDVLLKYDPKYLDIETELENENFFLNNKGSIFSYFTEPKIDREKGEIKFSALIENGAGFSGRVKVASLNFLAKQKGETETELVFQKGNIFDSNVSSFEKEEDILDRVENISISID